MPRLTVCPAPRDSEVGLVEEVGFRSETCAIRAPCGHRTWYRQENLLCAKLGGYLPDFAPSQHCMEWQLAQRGLSDAISVSKARETELLARSQLQVRRRHGRASHMHCARSHALRHCNLQAERQLRQKTEDELRKVTARLDRAIAKLEELEAPSEPPTDAAVGPALGAADDAGPSRNKRRRSESANTRRATRSQSASVPPPHGSPAVAPESEPTPARGHGEEAPSAPSAAQRNGNTATTAHAKSHTADDVPNPSSAPSGALDAGARLDCIRTDSALARLDCGARALAQRLLRTLCTSRRARAQRASIVARACLTGVRRAGLVVQTHVPQQHRAKICAMAESLVKQELGALRA